MVCNRCITAVGREFEKVGLRPTRVLLGQIQIEEESVSRRQLAEVDAGLKGLGFERIDDRRARLIEAIKKKIIELIHHKPQVARKYNWSKILSDEMHYDYNHLSNLFSSVEGVTLEHYIIKQRIEKVKELLFYDELSLSEIADRLGYSSLAHLSSQFKKVTGFTPSELKKSRKIELLRKPLDRID